jgi:hypothetical protein
VSKNLRYAVYLQELDTGHVIVLLTRTFTVIARVAVVVPSVKDTEQLPLPIGVAVQIPSANPPPGEDTDATPLQLLEVEIVLTPPLKTNVSGFAFVKLSEAGFSMTGLDGVVGDVGEVGDVGDVWEPEVPLEQPIQNANSKKSAIGPELLIWVIGSPL